MYTLTRIEGSNPSLSAIYPTKSPLDSSGLFLCLKHYKTLLSRTMELTVCMLDTLARRANYITLICRLLSCLIFPLAFSLHSVLSSFQQINRTPILLTAAQPPKSTGGFFSPVEYAYTVYAGFAWTTTPLSGNKRVVSVRTIGEPSNFAPIHKTYEKRCKCIALGGARVELWYEPCP